MYGGSQLQTDASEAARHALDQFWIENNVGFLYKYWQTATEALRKIAIDPPGSAEPRSSRQAVAYGEAVLTSHLEHHSYTGVLLTYAVFDEFMAALTSKLGLITAVRIVPSDLRDRGVRRYKKYVHQVCGIAQVEGRIDWDFLEDFTTVRNAIIHANGNKSLLSSPRELEQVVVRRSPMLDFKHEVKLRVSAEFVTTCMARTRETALAINGMAHPSIPGASNSDPTTTGGAPEA